MNMLNATQTRLLTIFCLITAVSIAASIGNVSLAQDSDQLEPITISDVDASGDAVFFSFHQNRVVTVAEADAGLWDIRFEGTSIYVNGEAQLLERPFDFIARAPESGYREDDETAGPAIPTATGEGWFDYDPTTHIVSTIPDKTILVHTVNDTYAKMEVLSYYSDQDESNGVPRHYTFRYVYRNDGSRELR